MQLLGALIMHSNRLHIWLLLLSVISRASCKEKTVTTEDLDYPDATIPEDYKSVADAKSRLGLFPTNDLDSETTSASPGAARASGGETSTARAEKVEVETSTTRVQEDEGEEVHGPANNSTQKKKHTIIDPVSVKILRGEMNGISATDLALPKPILYFDYSQAKVYSVDYHYTKKFMFFSALGTIFRDEVVGRLSRTRPPKVVATGVDGPVSLAVDWVHDRLYWMSVSHQTVEAADLDGNNRTLLVDAITGVKYPNNIAVDPYAGYLFLVNNHSVFRADLDGFNYTRLQLEGEGEGEGEDSRGVKCLALDPRERRVYYSGKAGDPEMGTPYIASCDYEGGNCKDHPLAYRWNDIFALDVFRDTLYFAHYSQRAPDTLYSVDLTRTKLTPTCLQSVTSANGGIYSIRVYHPGVQKDPKNKNCLEKHGEQKQGA